MRVAYEPLKGSRDRKRLELRFPQLSRYDELKTKFPSELKEIYEVYVTDVSNEVMAISLELGQFMYAICELWKPRRIADLGSGFSSIVFRNYAKISGSDVSVCSVDSSQEWLDRTKEFLSCRSIPTDGLLTWDALALEKSARYDLVFYDLGHIRELRKTALMRALDLIAPGGLMILDDMNFVFYKRYVRKVLSNLGLDAYSLESYTTDRLGRYSYMVLKN